MLRERTSSLVGAVEAGGTKFVCAVGTDPSDLTRTSFPTGDDPSHMMRQVVQWLRDQQNQRGKLEAIGIGSFGPVDLHGASKTYGHITSTPKPGWRSTDILGTVQKAFPGIPLGFDTDVNAAALGEFHFGAASGLEDFVYITIGTGIGAGGLVNGQLMHGLVHPEMGHMMLPRVAGDSFSGICPYHGACWEGLCSGPALLARAGSPAESLPPEHEAWSYEIQYIAFALANIVCVLSPRRIILGGSIRKAGHLGSDQFFRRLRGKVQLTLNKYVVSPALSADIHNYIVPPMLGDDAGVVGAMALAQEKVAAST